MMHARVDHASSISDRMQSFCSFLPLEDSVKAPRQPLYVCLSSLLFVFFLALAANAQQIDPKTYGGMKWLLFGPLRGGRGFGAAGGASQPDTHFFGAARGGGLGKDQPPTECGSFLSYKTPPFLP